MKRINKLHRELFMFLATAVILLIVAIVTQEHNAFISGIMTGATIFSLIGFTITAIQIERAR